MRESTLEKQFRQECVRRGYRCVKLQAVAEKGFPDRTVFRPGLPQVHVELKRPGGKLSIHQKRWIDWLKGNGYEAGWADNLDDAIGLLGDEG